MSLVTICSQATKAVDSEETQRSLLGEGRDTHAKYLARWGLGRMDFHFERELRLNSQPEHGNLYSWAINEVTQEGKVLGIDQIPWVWSGVFAAVDCKIVNSSEIRTISVLGRKLPEREVAHRRRIAITLRPGAFSDDEDDAFHWTRYSMFGTDRQINDFTLDIYATDEGDPEGCTAWGCPSYTAENDFRETTEPDRLAFWMAVGPETFARYVNLITFNAVTDIALIVGGVDGFYSEWSPSISTRNVKVLTAGKEQVIQAKSEEITPPRLGNVGEARLTFNRRIGLEDSKSRRERSVDHPERSDDGPIAGRAVTYALQPLGRPLWALFGALILLCLILLGR